MTDQELQDRIARERAHGLAYIAHLGRAAHWALGMRHDGSPMPSDPPIYRRLRNKR